MSTTKSRLGRRSDYSESRCIVWRHRSQILGRSDADHAALTSRIAIDFRPGDRTDSFLGKLIQPVGKNVLVAVSYDYEGSDSGESRRRIRLCGFRATVCRDGSVQYGGAAGCEFSMDGAISPVVGARGQVLDPARNPALCEQLHRMDKFCFNTSQGGSRPPTIPRMPDVLLGFAPDRPPEFEDSPALRRLAAKTIGVPVKQLGSNGPELLDALLRDCWSNQLIAADDPRNPTGTVLVSSEICTRRLDFLRAYEDMTSLVGLNTWNPAREVAPLEMANPARAILAEYHVDTTQNFNQPMEYELVAELERAMRHRLGPVEKVFTQEEILDGITDPQQPVKAWTRALPELRGRLSKYVDQCTADADLLKAARNPDKPLFARGACRLQVVRRRPMEMSRSLHFGPDDLGRRIDLDLRPPADWTPIAKRA